MDPMVVVASSAEVRCGDDTQNGVGVQGGDSAPTMLRQRRGEHGIECHEENPTVVMAWTEDL